MINKSWSRRGFLAAGGTLALAGCSGNEQGSTDPNEMTEVVIWDRSGAHIAAREKYFAEWTAGEGKRSGVKVSYLSQSTDRYEEIIRVGFQTKRAPDIFTSPSAQMGGFVAAGWVQPLTDLVDPEVLEKAKPYHPKNSELVWGGVPYAVPTTTFTNRMVINTELMEKAGLDPDSPPATFSEVRQAAAAITKAGKGDAFGFGIPVKAPGFRQWYIDLPLMAGDPELSNFGLFNSVQERYESTKYAPMIELFRQLIADQTAYPGEATLTGDVAWNAFGNGEIGMIFASSAIVSSLESLGSKVKAVGAPLPVPDGQTLTRIPMNAGYPYAISSTSENPQKAALAFEEMVGSGVQEALAEQSVAPLLDEVWDSPAIKDNAFLQDFRRTELDQQWPKTPAGVLRVEGERVDQTIERLILDPDEPLEPALQSMQERLDAAYQKAVEADEIDPEEFKA